MGADCNGTFGHTPILLSHSCGRMLGVTMMIEQKMGLEIGRDLIIKWEPEVRLGYFPNDSYDSYVIIHAESFYDGPGVRI